MKQILAAILVVAIFFVAINTPQRETATAQQQIEKLGKAITVIEQDTSKLTLDSLHALTLSIRELNELIANQSKEIQAVEQCQQADSEEFRTKLTALEAKETTTSEGCECNCAKELEDLKARVAALEARCPAPAVTSNYPAVSSVKSGGSTGTVVSTSSSGSTGTVVSSSYGSAGSSVATSAAPSTLVVQQQPRTPLRTAAAVVTAPIARAGHWSYPGEISNHLAKDHGVNPSGMTRGQMLNLHDSLHEGTAVSVQTPGVNVQTFSPARPPVFPRSTPVQVQNCPGGNCPTGPAQVQGFRLFRRR